MRCVWAVLVVCCLHRLTLGVLEPASSPSEPSLGCVIKLVRAHFPKEQSLRYSGSERPLLHALHETGAILMGGEAPSHAYVIAAWGRTDLIHSALPILAAAPDWNPLARFLVLVDRLRDQDLHPVFDAFLHLRAPFVLLVNGSHSADLYTYNSHTQNACGNYYTHVQPLGECNTAPATVYPSLPLKPHQNCFYNVSVSHWPPFTIDPLKISGYKPDEDPTNLGIEQYVFHLMSKVEGFRYRFYYDYDAEVFSVVSQNLSVEGPLTRLSRNESDVMLGGMLLLPGRARAFGFVHGHLDLYDEIRFLVRRAGLAPLWSDPYSCFTPTLWVIVALSLPLWAALVVRVARARDAGAVRLALLEGLLGRSVRLPGASITVRRLLVAWVMLGFLLNNFYSSTLVSFATSPRRAPQVADEEMLMARGLRPCISHAMGRFLQTEARNGDILQHVVVGGEGCTRQLTSAHTVSRSQDRFALVLYSAYLNDQYAFYDSYGQDLLYTFRIPYSKTVSAMYFNRGALTKRLHWLALRVRETGLVQKHLNGQYYKQQKKYRFKSRGWSARFAAPWHLYLAGVSAATLVLLAELAINARACKSAERV